MSLFDQGEIEVKVIVGDVVAASAMHVHIVPPAGELWELLYCDVFHTDAANPTGGWYFSDGTTTIQIGNAAVLNTGVRLPFYDAGRQLLYLSSNCDLKYDIAGGATAAEQLTANIVVRKLRGVV